MERISGNEIRRSINIIYFIIFHVSHSVHRSFKNKASAVKLRNEAYSYEPIYGVKRAYFTHAQLRYIVTS